MRRHRMTWPHRANLIGCAVANRENEIDPRSVRLGKLIPTLAARTLSREVRQFKLPYCSWVYLASGMASGAVGLESRRTTMVEDRLRHDRARRISRAKEENVVLDQAASVSYSFWPCSLIEATALAAAVATGSTPQQPEVSPANTAASFEPCMISGTVSLASPASRAVRM